ncbi:alpha/beta fold hydrolase [Nocardia sp. AG03]|uniref:esterase/lipase family protein n=1 Tax=Nocardia sp. AG03 TaxID=3025312 RepID=UPI00241881DA|nr:alpha/beta fold hydrolase [Nocardia sp. AG03]
MTPKAVAAAFLALMMLLGSAIVMSPVAPAAPTCDDAGHDDQISRLRPDRHPLVFVHGWLGDGNGWSVTAEMIEDRLPDTFLTMSFDYSAANSEWAASPRIAGCLAQYLRRISRAQQDMGGAGKIFVVGHSLGGLAARFASSADYGGSPSVGAVLAGITTIATPHLGSAWGDTRMAAAWQSWHEIPAGKVPGFLRSPDSHAARCLARHDEQRRLPDGCAYPPYAPQRVPVSQIAGNTVLHRTLLGEPLHDLDVHGDGMVTVRSATGYLPDSGAPGVPSPTPNGLVRTVTCRQDTEVAPDTLRGGGIAKDVALRAVAQAVAANDALVDLGSGSDELWPSRAGMLLAVATQLECGHNQLVYHPGAMDGLADALRAQLAELGKAPKIITLRPFAADGQLAPEWTVDSRDPGPIDCGTGRAATVSVEDGIYQCAPDASGVNACVVAGYEATCLGDPFTKTVLRGPSTRRPPGGVVAPADPVPTAVVLDDGTRCRLRVGGSWPVRTATPALSGRYFCPGGTGFRALWSRGPGPGYTETADGWMVEMGGTTGILEPRRIVEAYYVGLR